MRQERNDDGQASRIDRRGGYHMSQLSASHHPVSNTRRHGNRDDDETPARSEADDRKLTGQSERAIARERQDTIGSKQTAVPPAVANRHQPAPPTTRRAGEQAEASKSGRAGERG